MQRRFDRRRAIGPEWDREGASFRIYAPDHERAALVVDGVEHAMVPDGPGWWRADIAGARPGARYGFRFPGVESTVPDLASWSQPDGPHGLSELVDLSAFRWTDRGWTGISLAEAVIQEIHIGTFTPDGTLDAAAGKLPLLAELGINVVELMPVNDLPGRFNWGYDGVGWFAVQAGYGGPATLQRFVDRAHALGIAVLMDVVYNHLGPDGQWAGHYGRSYFSSRYKNEWGDPLNFDDDGADGMRALAIENAAFWIRDYHLDGLRFDATQQIFDAGSVHVVAECCRAAREAGGNRRLILVAENTPQETAVLKPAKDRGQELDAMWNEDFQRAARILVTGERDAYYSDLSGTAAELVGALRHGLLYQGQRSAWESKPRGGSTRGIGSERFVAYIENHDQVANSLTGARLVTLGDRKLLRAVVALLLLGPQTPMLFQGQEFGSSKPFVFFADHHDGLAGSVRDGRQDFLSQFPAVAADRIRDPGDPATVEACRLDWSERDRNGESLALYRDLIGLRRTDPVLAARGTCGLECSSPFPEIGALRYSGPDADRLLVINTGIDRRAGTMPDPLFAALPGRNWTTLFSTDDRAYGGRGRIASVDEGGWFLPGRSTVLLGC